MDDETLEFFAAHPSLLGRLAERAPAAVAAFGESLHVRGDRVVAPGGDAATPLWEGVIGEKLDAAGAVRPDPLRDGPRTARLPPRRPVAPRRADAGVRARLVAARSRRATEPIQAAGRRSRGAASSNGTSTMAPFVRPPNALAAFFARLRVDDSGVPAGLSSPAFWQRAFDERRRGHTAGAVERQRGVAGGVLPRPPQPRTRAAARCLRVRAARVSSRGAGRRRARKPTTWSRPSGASRAYPVLMLTLERMGVRAPAIYAAAAQQAERLTDLDQIARIDRARAVPGRAGAALAPHARADDRRRDGRTARARSRRLSPRPTADINGAIAAWLDERVRPAAMTTAIGGPVPASIGGPGRRQSAAHRRRYPRRRRGPATARPPQRNRVGGTALSRRRRRRRAAAAAARARETAGPCVSSSSSGSRSLPAASPRPLPRWTSFAMRPRS